MTHTRCYGDRPSYGRPARVDGHNVAFGPCGKAVIAAQLAPQKLGSMELCFHAVGVLLEQAGWDVRYWFSGDMSQSVRDRLGVSAHRIALNQGTVDEAGRMATVARSRQG